MEQQPSRKSARTARSSTAKKENGTQGSPIRVRKSLGLAGRVPMSPLGQIPAAEHEEAMQCEPVEQQPETVTPPTLPASASAASAPRLHFPRARPAMDKHATLFASLDGGMPAHTSPDPMSLPAGMTRGNRSRFMLLHYPSPHSEKHGGYVTEAGHATDDTTRIMARAVNKSLPDGQVLLWQQQFDFWGDLYDGPHALKVGKAAFSWHKHFYKKLSKADKDRWWDSKVHVLASVICDEIERGRDGADCFVAGSEPLEWWPKILKDAIAEASRILDKTISYDIRFPSTAAGDLPPLTREGSEDTEGDVEEEEEAEEEALPCGDHKVYHPSAALHRIPYGHRVRLDAAIKWVQGPILADATVTYFQSLTPKYGGSYSEAERRTLLDDAKAREGGYEGPSPLEATLTAPQQAARKAAISRAGSVRLCGGREAVEKQLKKPFAQVTDAELSTLQDDAKAREGGYEGPSPLEATLTAAQQAARKAAISAACSRWAKASAGGSSEERSLGGSNGHPEQGKGTQRCYACGRVGGSWKTCPRNADTTTKSLHEDGGGVPGERNGNRNKGKKYYQPRLTPNGSA